MSTETTYEIARSKLGRLCDEVTSTGEPVIIRRKGAKDVALIDADELRSLTETAHLLRSPRNARRLQRALARARRNRAAPSTAGALRRDLGLGEDG